jgi:hypothetical protein
MRIRRFMALVFLAVALSSFASFMWMFFEYQSSRPSQPHPELGRVYPSNNHGSYVYLTGEEATGLALLLLTFPLSFLLSVTMVPGQDRRGSAPFSRREHITIWIVMICYETLILFAGPSIARLVVSHGLVLNL